MIKKVLLIETTLVSAFIAAFFSIAAHASTSSHSIYKLGGVYPEP